MKTLYSINFNGIWAKRKRVYPLFLLLFSFAVNLEGFTQPCPTATLSSLPVCAGQPINLTLNTTPASTETYSLLINGIPYNGIVPGVPFVASGTIDNLFGSAVPLNINLTDPSSNELGVKFESNQAGFIKGIRFYKALAATGPFTGSLWDISGNLLATGTFTTPNNASGWQELIFSAPVAITANTLYVASYFSPNGIYTQDEDGFEFAKTSTFLTAPASTGLQPNGVYRVGSTGFPNLTYNRSNYSVDVNFIPSTPVTTYNLTDITSTSGPACSSSGSPIDVEVVTINPFLLTAGTVSASGGSTAGQQANLTYTPGAGVAPYSIVINGATSTNVTPPTPFLGGGIIPEIATSRIWSASDLTGSLLKNSVIDDGVPNVEVGHKFQVTFPGIVRKLIFYKGVANTETTTLTLYDEFGSTVASTTYTDPGGTVTGFIQVPISSVTLLANTTYVVTYFNPGGDYVSKSGVFANDVIRGSLKGLEYEPFGVGNGPNGVYRIGQGFPNTFCAGCEINYFADVEFQNLVTEWPLTVSQITDANGCTLGVNQNLLITGITNNGTLPVTITEFSASVIQNKDVKLNWTTASESNNKGFEVERSTDAAKWLKVGFVAGNGNSNQTRKYSLLDKDLSLGKYFYRLKQIDIDGKFYYSNILSVDINGKLAFELNQSFPNPTHGASTITYSIPVKSQVTLTVYDMQGRVVRVLQNGERAAGKYAVTVPSDLLKKGVYHYRLEAGDFKSTRKMIVQ